MALGNRHSQHSFAKIPAVNMQRSQFDRSFGVKDTLYMDYLRCVFLDEIIPGDTANLNVNAFARMATLVNPIMDNIYLDFFFFFVPCRLVWDNWEKFCGAQTDPGDSTDYLIPTLPYDATTGLLSQMGDAFGLPQETITTPINVNALPFRAAYLIWNQWFRDQNVQDSLVVPMDDGPDAQSDYVQEDMWRNKKHDYFTSMLPWPQKGDAVELGFADSNVVRDSNAATWTGYNAGTNNLAGSGAMNTSGGGLGKLQTASGPSDLSLDPNGGLTAVTSALAITINELREAFQIQSILELDARGGTRYVEILQNHFNVVSPDFRLQRSEYLGGGTIRVNMHPVAQTSATSGSNYLANLGAFATASASGSQIGFTKSFVEHGYVLGFACPRGEVTYQQGINKLFLRSTRFDFFWPKLQQIGEQAVTRKELYALGVAADDVVIGYQERFAEYRYKPSEIHGEFRSSFATSLDSWHLAQEFINQSALTLAQIIPCDTPIARAQANSTSADVLLDLWYDYKHARPMMTYSVPATLGRF